MTPQKAWKLRNPDKVKAQHKRHKENGTQIEVNRYKWWSGALRCVERLRMKYLGTNLEFHIKKEK